MFSLSISSHRISLTAQLRHALLHLSIASLGTIAILTASDRTVIAQTPLTNNSQIVIDAISPIQMIAKAQAAKEMHLIQGASRLLKWQCTYFRLESSPEGLRLMVINGEIVQVDVMIDSRI